MTAWRDYLTDKEPVAVKKQKKGPGCKRNKINKNRLGPCSFSEENTCIYCRRPRRRNVRLDIKTGNIIVEFLE